jgi:hypothetical protein
VLSHPEVYVQQQADRRVSAWSGMAELHFATPRYALVIVNWLLIILTLVGTSAAPDIALLIACFNVEARRFVDQTDPNRFAVKHQRVKLFSDSR